MMELDEAVESLLSSPGDEEKMKYLAAVIYARLYRLPDAAILKVAERLISVTCLLRQQGQRSDVPIT